jgi:hypothetical protein
VLVVAVVAAVLVVIVIAVVIVSRSSSDASSNSTVDDWVNSICRPGSYMTSGGAQEPNATSDTWCISKSGGTGIDFYTYSSNDLMQQDLKNGQGTYATGTDSSGALWLVRSVQVHLYLRPWRRSGSPSSQCDSHCHDLALQALEHVAK